MKRRTFLAGAALGLAACSPAGEGATPQSVASTSGESGPTEPTSVDGSGDGSATSSVATTTTAQPSAPTSASGESATDPTIVNSGPAVYVAHGDRNSTSVALTFHLNGDLRRASKLLDVLAAANATVTVFAVGTFLEANRSFAASLLGAGHVLGNHTWSHQPMRRLAPNALAEEIVRGRDIVDELNGATSPWFRPSGIDVPTDAILAAAGASGYGRSVGYDVDPKDYSDPGASVIVTRVLADVTGGSIISMHFDHVGTIEAMPELVQRIRDRGFDLVTVAQMLG